MKNFIYSKTLWFNAAVGTLGWFLNHQGIMAAAGISQQMQTEVVMIVNLVLRVMTTQALITGTPPVTVTPRQS